MIRNLGGGAAGALLFLALAGAAAGATRTTAFSPVDPGVRAGAMGGAFTALGGDPSALYWNPATLFYMQGRSVEASYADLYGLGLARKTYLSVGLKSVIEEPRFDRDRVVVGVDDQTGAAYAFSLESLFLDLDEDGYSELSVGGGAAWGYGDRLALGVSLRALFVSSDYDDVSAFGYDLGLGLAYRTSRREKLALSAPHLLSRLFWKFDSTERLPFNVVLGWSRAFNPDLLVSVEGELREGENSPYRLAAGAEWWVVPSRLAARAGFRHLAGDVADINKPTFGAAVRFTRLRFDYAFRLGPDALGDTHRVGLLFDF